MIRLKKIVAAVLVLSLAIPYPSFAQDSFSFLDKEKDAVCRWTKNLLWQHALYETTNRAQAAGSSFTSGSVIQSVNDPYYNSSGSWGQAYDDMWGLKRINIEDAWLLSRGEGALVAVLDTGVDYNHIDINDNIWTNAAELNGLPGVDDDGNGYVDDIRGWDFHNSDNNPMDGHGHGSHVAGIIAAEGDNDEGIIGVANKAKVMAIKIISDIDTAYGDRIAAGIRYAVDMGAKILSCSFSVAYSSVIIDAFQYAYNKGAIIIAAAGNDNSSIAEYPAKLDYAITVGSINPSSMRSSFSNYGNELDVVAPGEDILSLRATGTNAAGSSSYLVPQGDPNAKYLRLSGTSMATPFVSGLAALMYSQDSDLSFAEFVRRLKFSSVDLGTTGWDQYYGWGRIDAFAALSHDWYDSGVIRTWWLATSDEFNVIRYDYYESGDIMSKRFASPTSDNIIRYDYYDSGNVMSKWLASPDVNNVIRYDYFDSGEAQSKWLYTPDLDNVIRYLFYKSGCLDTKWLNAADASGNIRYSYFDENFNSVNGRIYTAESSSGTLHYYYGYDYNSQTSLVDHVSSLWIGSGAAKEFNYYDISLTNILHKRIEFDYGNVVETNILSGGDLQITKFYYSTTAAWFLWGNDVYKEFDNVVVEHTEHSAKNLNIVSYPANIEISPDGSRLYISGSYAYSVKAMNTSTDSIEFTVSLNTSPNWMAVTPDDKYIYFTANATSDHDNLRVIDLNTKRDMGISIPVGYISTEISITPDSKYVYVSSMRENYVSVIDIASQTLLKNISLAGLPYSSAASPDGKYIYIGKGRDGDAKDFVSIIDTSTQNVVKTIEVGDYPKQIVFSNNGSYAVVVNGNHSENGCSVNIIDTATQAVVKTIKFEGGVSYAAFTNDDKYIYTATAPRTISVIDMSSLTVCKTISVGSQSSCIAMLKGQDRAYVTNFASDYLSVIDTSTHSLVEDLYVGKYADKVVANPNSEYAYVQSSNVLKIVDEESWRAYTFLPDASQPENIIDRSKWTFCEEISNPETIQDLLPELGDWWQYCKDNNIVPEFPALSSDYTRDGLSRVIQKIDHNPYMDTTNNYTWDYGVTGRVKWDVLYDYDKDGDLDQIASRIYINGDDYDISHIKNWQQYEAPTYDMFLYYPNEFNDDSAYYNETSGGTETNIVALETRTIGSVVTRIHRDQVGQEQYITTDADGIKLYGIKILIDTNGDDTPDALADMIFDAPLLMMTKTAQVGNVVQGSTTATFLGSTVTVTQSTTFDAVEDLTITGRTMKDLFKITTVITAQGVFTSTTTSWFMKYIGSVKDVIVGGDTRTIKYANTHYASGNLKAKVMGFPDGSGSYYYEYFDENFYGGGWGRFSKGVKADGSYDLFVEYWEGTDKVKTKESYDAFGTLLARYEYATDGTTLASKIDYATGIIEEWLPGGIYRKLVMEPSGYHTYTYKDGHLILENDPVWGTKRYDYDASWNFLGYTRIYEIPAAGGGPNIRMKEIYDSSYRLISKYEWGTAFYTGVNLPWLDYGKDIGRSHATNAPPVQRGFSTKRDILDARMRELAGAVTRVFVFNDLRSGIELDGSGNIIGFDEQSVSDLRELLNSAQANGVKLILTLFDYLLADGESETTYWNGSQWITEQLGEYPQFITDSAKRTQLISAVKDLFERAGLNDYSCVVGFDIMNEPEYAHDWGGISYDDLRNFVYGFRDMLHTDFAGRFVTVGSRNKEELMMNWDTGLDMYQFHYYNWMGSLDVPVTDLGLPGPVFVGELQPTDFANKLKTLYDNGYLGGMFWQDTSGSFTISAADLQVLLNFFVGTMYEYYAASGRMWKKTDPSMHVFEYSNEDWNGHTWGKLLKETRPDGTYKTFSDYFAGTDQARYVREYSATGVLLVTYEYDNLGRLAGKTENGITYTYYIPSGRMHTKLEGGILNEYTDEDWNGHNYGKLIKQTNSDGSYKVFGNYFANTDQAGTVAGYTALDELILEAWYDATGSLLKKVEYYVSGNVKTRFDPSVFGDSRTETYIDEAYYIYNGHGMGRLQRMDYPDGNWQANQYYGNTTRVWKLQSFDAPSAEEHRYEFYDEEWASNVKCDGMISGSLNSGRVYQYIRIEDGVTTEDLTIYGYMSGTPKRLVEYNAGVSDAYGADTLYYFYDNSQSQIAGRIEFASGMTAEILFMPDQTVRVTKTSIAGATYWFLWGDNVYEGRSNVVIEHTAGGQWNAYYGFRGDPQNPESVFDQTAWTLIGAIADPDAINLPELGNWWQYCVDNYIIPEFPPLSSDQVFDGGRIVSKTNHNPYMDTFYTYTWDYETSGQMKIDIVYDYNKDGSVNQVYSIIYHNGSDYDISHVGQWAKAGEAYWLKGEEYSYYLPSGRIHTKKIAGTIYEYTDEDWNGHNYGKLIKQTNPDGSYKIFSDYFAGTDQAGLVREYDAEGTLLVTREYYSTGILKKETKSNDYVFDYYETGNLARAYYPKMGAYEYINETFDFNGNGQIDADEHHGRLSKEIFADGSYVVYSDYYAGLNICGKKEEYNRMGELTATTEYYRNGVIKKKMLADGSAFEYYETGMRKRTVTPDGFEYNYDETGRMISKEYPDGAYIEDSVNIAQKQVTRNIYADDSKTVLLKTEIYTYETDPTNYSEWQLAMTIEPNGYTQTRDAQDRVATESVPGVFSITYNYYDLTPIVSSKTYTNLSTGSTITYEYDPLSRLTREVIDNRIEVFIMYQYGASDKIYKILGRNIADPGHILFLYEYRWDGTLKSVKSNEGQAFEAKYDQKGRIKYLKVIGVSETMYGYDAVTGNFANKVVKDLVTGNTIITEYQSNGKVKKITDLSGKVWEYDAFGRLTKEHTAPYMTVYYEYLPDGNMNYIKKRVIQDDLFQSTVYIYNASGILQDSYVVTDVVDDIDTAGRLVKRTYYDGSYDSYTYYGDTQAVHTYTYVDRDGKTKVETYNESGDIVSLLEWNELFTTYSYDAEGRLERVERSDGTSETYEYWGDTANIKKRTTLEFWGQRIVEEYGETTGLLDKITYWYGDYYSYYITHQYDVSGRLVRTDYSYGGHAECEYWGDSDTLKIMRFYDSANHLSTYDYNELGNVVKFTSYYGYSYTYSYDGLNRLARVDYSYGSYTLNEYYGDSDRLKKTSYWYGTTCYSYTEYEYYGDTDRMKSQTYIYGNGSYYYRYEYDPLNGKIVKVSNSYGYDVYYTYDSLGRTIRSDYSYGYSEVCTYYGTSENYRTVTYTYEDDWFVTYNYLADGRIDSIVDSAYGTTSYIYDTLKRLTSVLYSDGSHEEYAYDGDSDRVITWTYHYADNTSDTYTYEYYPDSYDAKKYTYTDRDGNTTVYEYLPGWRLSKITNPDGSTAIYTYDANNRVSRIDYSSGDYTTYEYYDGWRTKKVLWHYADGTESYYEYTYYTGDYYYMTMTYKYVERNGDTTFYEYNIRGQLWRLTRPSGIVETYSYDSWYRKTRVDYSNGAYDIYTYDSSLWRLQRIDRYSATGGHSYDAYTYHNDVFGNTGMATHTIGYEDGTTRTFFYDVRGVIVKEILPDGRTAYYSKYENGYVVRKDYSDGTYEILGDYWSTGQAGTVRKYNAEGALLETCQYDSAGTLTNRIENAAVKKNGSGDSEVADRLTVEGAVVTNFDDHLIGQRAGSDEKKNAPAL